MMQYCQDYDERYTGRAVLVGSGRNSWFTMISPYIKSVQVPICPSDPSPHSAWGNPAVSYGWNCYAGGADAPGRRMAEFTKPSETAMLLDHDNACAKVNAGCACGSGSCSIGQTNGIDARVFRGSRHNEGNNVGFFDGHVKWRKGAELNPRLNGAQNLIYRRDQ